MANVCIRGHSRKVKLETSPSLGMSQGSKGKVFPFHSFPEICLHSRVIILELRSPSSPWTSAYIYQNLLWKQDIAPDK